MGTIRLTINPAGDMRLTSTLPRRHMQSEPGCCQAPLVCSSKLQVADNSKPSWDRVGFGSISKRLPPAKRTLSKLRQLACVLDQSDRARQVFLTGTLPGSTPEALQALAAHSAWVVQALHQWVRDVAPGSELVGVWEYQRRGALHVHLCVLTPAVAVAQRILHAWKERWLLILDSVSSRSQTDLYQRARGGTWAADKGRVRTDAQFVRKSAAAYLGKYLSKGARKRQAATCYPPSRWCFVSRTLRDRHKAQILTTQVSNLDPLSLISLFERIGALMSEATAKTFSYSNPYDPGFHGLISLLNPIQASLLYDHVAPLLRCLQGLDKVFWSPHGAPISAVANMFCGKHIYEPRAA